MLINKIDEEVEDALYEAGIDRYENVNKLNYLILGLSIFGLGVLNLFMIIFWMGIIFLC